MGGARRPTRRPIGATGLAVAAALGGCVTTVPEKHSLGLIALHSEEIRLRILERGVRAEHCKAGFASSGDIGEAVERAVSQVDGARVLANASIYARQTPTGVCVEVVGDAAAID